MPGDGRREIQREDIYGGLLDRMWAILTLTSPWPIHTIHGHQPYLAGFGRTSTDVKEHFPTRSQEYLPTDYHRTFELSEKSLSRRG